MSADSTIQFHKESKQQLEVYTQDTIQSRIMTIRGHQVIMDADLAEFYQVKTIALNQRQSSATKLVSLCVIVSN